MQEMKSNRPNELIEMAEKFTENEWKRVAVCWHDGHAFDLFDRMRAGLENPAFLFAYCPANNTSLFCRDLFEWARTKPYFRDEALEAYFTSPHYQTFGTAGLRTFPVADADKETKQKLLDHIIETASAVQLLDLSLIPEKVQEPALKERVKDIPLVTLLDIFYQASKGKITILKKSWERRWTVYIS